MYTITVLLLAAWVGLGQAQPATNSDDTPSTNPAGLAVTYLANEGTLIEAGDHAVLIDALFREGVTGYDRLSAKELERLETAQPPYNKVQAVLVTHRHADHFDAASVLRHLQHNPQARLVSSKQVTELVINLPECDANIRQRIISVEPVDREKVVVDSAGPKIEALLLSHGERMADIVNLGFIVHIGGKRFLHIGDASHNSKTTRPLVKHAVGVDVAFVPYWLLLEPSTRGFYQRRLAPGHVVAFHIEPAQADRIAATLGESFPEATVCTQRMTNVRF